MSNKEENINQSTSHKGEKRRSFTLEFKLMVVDFANSKSNYAAAKKYGIDGKRVREWKSNADKLKNGGAKRKKLEGGGCKVKNLNSEKLLKWIHERRSDSLPFSEKLIRRKAKQMYDEQAGEDIDAKNNFKASLGWLERFMIRNGLSLQGDTVIILKKEPVSVTKDITVPTICRDA